MVLFWQRRIFLAITLIASTTSSVLSSSDSGDFKALFATSPLSLASSTASPPSLTSQIGPANGVNFSPPSSASSTEPKGMHKSISLVHVNKASYARLGGLDDDIDEEDEDEFGEELLYDDHVAEEIRNTYPPYHPT